MKWPFVLLFACSGIVTANVEPPLPEWDAEQRARILNESWTPGGILLSSEPLPGEEVPEVLPLLLEKPSEEYLREPVDGQDIVAEEFLAGYFEDKPGQYLVDPQGLLSVDDAREINVILDYHASDSSIDMYAYVFGVDQQIPGNVREEEVVERLYSEGKSALVVYYYLGDPQRSEIYLSPMITEAVSAAEQRRALKSSVVQGLADENPAAQLQAFLSQMSIRIYWMERMADGTAAETKEAIPRTKTNEVEEAHSAVRSSSALPSWAGFASMIAASVGVGVILIGVLIIWLRSRSRFLFPENEIETRLGGSTQRESVRLFRFLAQLCRQRGSVIIRKTFDHKWTRIFQREALAKFWRYRIHRDLDLRSATWI